MRAKPKTVAVTLAEGGDWHAFPLGRRFGPGKQVHSIKFSDGSEWDAVNGWRGPRPRGCGRRSTVKEVREMAKLCQIQ
jgi:hypothetical protein